jgi:phosphatidylglycerophosphate synthase
MFDRLATRLIRPAVDALAAPLARAGVQANTVTWLGLGLGLGAAALIANGFFALGGLVIVLSRACDALDGAIARQTHATDLGGFLDIVLDFVFYASIPLAFAIENPTHNALAAALLLAAFVGTGSSFLAFAVIAAKRNLDNVAYPNKSFYFLGGLTEGFETLVCFIAMCCWPAYFSDLALGFSALCLVTLCSRIAWGVRAFSDPKAA